MRSISSIVSRARSSIVATACAERCASRSRRMRAAPACTRMVLSACPAESWSSRAIRAPDEDVTVDGVQVRITGVDALSAGVLVELLVAATAALAVLALVFGSTLALAPLPMAICAIPVSFPLLLLDATVIRALLLPAVVSLFGRWN